MTNIVIDRKPYCPDIYFENEKYKISDVLSERKINSGQNIFIVNIDSLDNQSQYSDPLYMIYGVFSNLSNNNDNSTENTTTTNTTNTTNITNVTDSNIFPPFYFYKYDPEFIIKRTLLKTSIDPSINSLLKNIGYDTDQINETNFIYSEISCYDSISLVYRPTIFIYFTYNNFQENTFNYNNFKSNLYYKTDFWNILIYPFIQTIPSFCSYIPLYTYHFKFNSKNLIPTLNFDDTENVEFYNKLDFKYFQDERFNKHKINHLSLIKNYSKYMENSSIFINNQVTSENILISLNEISKMSSPVAENEPYNVNSIEELFNMNYCKKNKIYSSSDKKYSMSFDAKSNYSSLIKNKNINKYFPFNIDISHNNSIDEFYKNYIINGFISITDQTILGDQIFIINQYLRRTYLIINPYIIDSDYLLDSVNFEIISLNENQNNFQILNQTDQTNICDKGYIFGLVNINFSNTFYFNYYKIIYSFKDYQNTTEDNIFTYEIILKIAFFNSSNLTIQNLNKTSTSNDLAITSFNEISQTFSLMPCISNNSKNNFFQNNIYFDFKNIKFYNFILNYDKLTNYKYSNNIISTYHFYTIIPNIKNYFFNIKTGRINNFISSVINLDIYFESLYYYQNKNFLDFSFVYDDKIDKLLIREFTVLNNFSSNLCSEKFENLLRIPKGKYIVLRYTNINPTYKITESSQENNIYVKNVNNIKNFLDNDFSLFIKIPENYQPNSFLTHIYLVVNFYDGTPYLYDQCYDTYSTCNDNLTSSTNQSEDTIDSDIIYNKFYLGYELFNFSYNTSILTNLKLFKNLFYGKYMNMNTLNIIMPFYKIYNEKTSLIIDIDNTLLNIHNDLNIQNIINYDCERFLFDNCILAEYEILFYNSQYTITTTYLNEVNNINNSNQDDNNTTTSTIFSNYNEYYHKKHLKFIMNPYEMAKFYYDSKIEIYKLNLNQKRLGFIFNTSKIIKYLEKCKNLLQLIIYNKILKNENIQQYLDYLKNNIKIVINYTTFNYNLNITYSVISSIILNTFYETYLVNDTTTLENFNFLLKEIQFAISYEIDKIKLVKDEIFQYLNENKCSKLFDIIFFEDIKKFISQSLEAINKNNDFIDKLENNIQNFINLISDQDILSQGFINISRDGFHDVNNLFYVYEDCVLELITNQENNIKKCDQNYIFNIKEYLKLNFNLFYKNDPLINELNNFFNSDNNILEIIVSFINCFECFIRNNEGTIFKDVLENVISILQPLTIETKNLISNIQSMNDTNYDMNDTTYTDLENLNAQYIVVVKLFRELVNFLEIIKDVLGNDSFNCFYGYYNCILVSVEEYIYFKQIKTTIFKNRFTQTENKLIKIIELLGTGYFLINVVFNIVQKAIKIYIKENFIVSIAEIIQEIVNELSQNEIFNDLINIIQQDLSSKIDSVYNNLVETLGNETYDQILLITKISNELCVPIIFNILQDYLKLNEIYNLVENSQIEFENKFLILNRRVQEIINYNYLNNPYVYVNIENVNITS